MVVFAKVASGRLLLALMLANGPAEDANEENAELVETGESDNERRIEGREGTKADVAGKARPAMSFWAANFELSIAPIRSKAYFCAILLHIPCDFVPPISILSRAAP